MKRPDFEFISSAILDLLCNSCIRFWREISCGRSHGELRRTKWLPFLHSLQKHINLRGGANFKAYLKINTKIFNWWADHSINIELPQNNCFPVPNLQWPLVVNFTSKSSLIEKRIGSRLIIMNNYLRTVEELRNTAGSCVMRLEVAQYSWKSRNTAGNILSLQNFIDICFFSQIVPTGMGDDS